MKKPKISIVIGSYNRKKFLKKTIENIRNNNISVPYEIIVIDGGSDDGSLGFLIKQKDIITIVQHNRGTWRGKNIERKSWGYFMNIAFKASHGKYLVMLSDDCLLLPNSIMNSFFLFEKELKKGKRLGAIAFYFRDYPIQEDYAILYTFKHTLFVNHGMYLKEALSEVGYIDEDNYQFYYADGDICAKMWQKGIVVIDSPNSIVEHFFHANESIRQSNYLNKAKSFQTFKSKWNNIFYTKNKYNVRGKKFLTYTDKSDTAKFFNQTYRSQEPFFKKILNTYIKRRQKIIAHPNKIQAIILLEYNQKLFLLNNNKNKTLPIITIKNKEMLKFEAATFTRTLINFDKKDQIKIIGQSGIRPEDEVYFFKLQLDRQALKRIIHKGGYWREINKFNNKNTNPNHLPFLKM